MLFWSAPVNFTRSKVRVLSFSYQYYFIRTLNSFFKLIGEGGKLIQKNILTRINILIGAPMNLQTLLKQKREQVLETAAYYGAYDVRVFGSVARGEADENSDIDLLVKLEPGRSLMDLGGLLYDL